MPNDNTIIILKRYFGMFLIQKYFWYNIITILNFIIIELLFCYLCSQFHKFILFIPKDRLVNYYYNMTYNFILTI